MAFEFADIFFGSHQKREGIPTPADGAVRIYKKVGKSFTTSGFFKKSSDIFFGATSHKGTVAMIQIATVLFYFSLLKSLDIKPKARLVGSNVNLPTSIFSFMEFLANVAAGKSEPTLPKLLIFHRIIKRLEKN